jgi:TatD DNase family protein
MKLELFDTHAHLNKDDFGGQVGDVIHRARQSGLVGVMTIGIDVASSRVACDLASTYPGFVFAAVGIQPNSAGAAGPQDFDQIRELARLPGVRAVGETGLDCYWDDTPIDQQQRYFDEHLQLCRETGLPVVIHMRDSGELILQQLRQQSSVPAGVMHSFTGDRRLAEQCLELGLHLSFAGMVTFKASEELRQVARAVPEDRLLVETDSPYLSPEPLRGRRPNEPARVEHTLRCLADARGVSAEHLARITTANAKRLLRIP